MLFALGTLSDISVSKDGREAARELELAGRVYAQTRAIVWLRKHVTAIITGYLSCDTVTHCTTIRY